MTLEYNSYRMAWGLLSLPQKQRIYEAMKQLPGGELAAQIVMADQTVQVDEVEDAPLERYPF